MMFELRPEWWEEQSKKTTKVLQKAGRAGLTLFGQQWVARMAGALGMNWEGEKLRHY
jgi:hypothetical protein